jgi:thioredoxin 1
MAKSVLITDDNFEKMVINSENPVFVDFWATWCGPCIAMAPIVDQMAADYEGKITVGKLDVDENPDSAAKFGIRSIPTMLIFKGGQVVDKVVGSVPKSELVKRFEAVLK